MWGLGLGFNVTTVQYICGDSKLNSHDHRFLNYIKLVDTDLQ